MFIEGAVRLQRTDSKPPLSYPGAAADCDRAKKTRLAEPSATNRELNPGDRVEGLGNFGKRLGISAQLSKLTKMTRSGNGMMMVG